MATEQQDWILNVFQEVDMFHALTLSEINGVIGHMNCYQYKKGQTIVSPGDRGNSFFVIHKGRVEVIVKKGLFKNVKAKELGPGQFFGEMALLLDQPRNATVRALEDTDCFVLFRTDFQNMVHNNPAFAKFVRATSEQRSFENEQG